MSSLRSILAASAASFTTFAVAHAVHAAPCLTQHDVETIITNKYGVTKVANMVSDGFIETVNPSTEIAIDACHNQANGGFVGEVGGAIEALYSFLGGPLSFIEWPLTNEINTLTNDGRVNYFEGGRFDGGAGAAIYWSPATGAHELHGMNYSEYHAYKETASGLGYPTSDETACTLQPCSQNGRQNTMQNGFIEFSTLAGNPLAQESWGLLSVFQTPPNLIVSPTFNGDNVDIIISSSNWPFANGHVQLSVNTPSGRFVEQTVAVTNGHIQPVMVTASRADGIGGTGPSSGHVVVTVEATTVEDLDFTQLAAVEF